MDKKHQCKGCTASVRLSDDEINDVIPCWDTDTVSEEIYKKRLEKCKSCSSLVYGTTCKHCGCLVKVRAKRKDGYCPYPGDSKW